MEIFTEESIDKFIKDNYQPVEDKPGYVWFNKRNWQIISIETLKKSLKEFCKRKEKNNG